jgi:hypothetical protein
VADEGGEDRPRGEQGRGHDHGHHRHAQKVHGVLAESSILDGGDDPTDLLPGIMVTSTSAGSVATHAVRFQEGGEAENGAMAIGQWT